MTSLLMTNARLIDAAGITRDGWLRIRGALITERGQGDPGRLPGESVIDCGGDLLAPGFIDLHTHGGGGASVEDGPQAMRAALAVWAAHGTTRTVWSLVAGPPERLTSVLAGVAALAEDEKTGVLGAHAEGPFLAPARRGAHDPESLRAPSLEEAQDLVAAARGYLRQITIAPELPGALPVIEALVAAGVRVAVGHTEASFEQAAAAFDHGATLLTHAFNAMPGIHHRDPGPVLAALGDARVTLEVVFDGVHLADPVARLVFAAAPGRVALITDAMAATGMPDGEYRLGSLGVTVHGGRAVVAGTDTIAGSTLTQDVALRRAVAAGVDLTAAVAALTLTPAAALGLETQFGLLDPGYVADLVRLSPDLHVKAVWRAGVSLS